MIIPDVNVLIYAHIEEMPHHELARSLWERCLNGTESIGLSWSVLTGFIRLTTKQGLFERPLPIRVATDLVTSWRNHPLATDLNPKRDHLQILAQNLVSLGAGGNVVPDAHLATLASEYGGTVYSTDNDFARFPDTKWINPIL